MSNIPGILLVIVCQLLVTGCICCGTQQEQTPQIQPDNGKSSSTYTPSTNLVDETPSTLPSNPAESSDLSEVFESGLSYHCTFLYRKTLSETWRYKLQYAGWKYLLDIDNGKGRKAHIIYDGEWQYVWTDGASLGDKYKVSKTLGITGQIDSDRMESGKKVWVLTDYLKAEDAKEVDCVQKPVDSSIFTPPKNIRFREGKSRFDYL